MTGTDQNGGSAPTLLNRALGVHAAGDLAQAEQLYRAVLESDRRQPMALAMLGTVHAQRGDYAEALRLLKRSLKSDPNNPIALNTIGIAQQQLKRYDEALVSLDNAIALRPGFAAAYCNRANVLREMKHYDRALADYARAYQLDPNFAEAHHNCALALQELKRDEESLTHFSRAIALKPSYAEAYNGRGNALRSLKQYQGAVADFRRASALKPQYAEAYANCGTALRELGRHDAAIASFDQAITLNPNLSDLHYARGVALEDIKRYEEAIASYERALALEPAHRYAAGERLYSKICASDWRGLDEDRRDVLGRIERGVAVVNPYALTMLSSDPALQRKAAEFYARDAFPSRRAPLWRAERYGHERIRIAYVSSDYCSHAVAYLIVGLLEEHDRSRFEITGFALTESDGSPIRARIEAAFERFADATRMSDAEAARQLRSREIDIAVDLNGCTQGARTGIFTHRPAPVQVNYLGYPGTMGMECIDYLIADRATIPPGDEAYYAEKIVRLPQTYQSTDAKRFWPERTPSRNEAGLPAEGFVFASFNLARKITPTIFGIWMRLLNAVPGSVLWLLDDNPYAIANLRREAEARGINAGRLIFAPRVDPDSHLARHRLADLFLDTLPYNAHTTASDALWVGLPVLTCVGTNFAGRVAGGLLRAIGLPETIATDLSEYETIALALARDPARLVALRAKLAHNRLIEPLFDTKRFARNIEAAYERMWCRVQEGLPPQAFDVEEK